MKPNFLNPLQLEAVLPNTWRLLSSFGYHTLITGKPQTITVPVGFENDLASIPRLFRNIIPVNGRHRWPAVIHDYLYSKKGILGDRMRFTRKECDQIFLEGMKVMKVGFIKRSLMYNGVRAGGWVYFNKS
jgi:hypothetical protein